VESNLFIIFVAVTFKYRYDLLHCYADVVNSAAAVVEGLEGQPPHVDPMVEMIVLYSPTDSARIKYLYICTIGPTLCVRYGKSIYQTAAVQYFWPNILSQCDVLRLNNDRGEVSQVGDVWSSRNSYVDVKQWIHLWKLFKSGFFPKKLHWYTISYYFYGSQNNNMELLHFAKINYLS